MQPQRPLLVPAAPQRSWASPLPHSRHRSCNSSLTTAPSGPCPSHADAPTPTHTREPGLRDLTPCGLSHSYAQTPSLSLFSSLPRPRLCHAFHCEEHPTLAPAQPNLFTFRHVSKLSASLCPHFESYTMFAQPGARKLPPLGVIHPTFLESPQSVHLHEEFKRSPHYHRRLHSRLMF